TDATGKVSYARTFNWSSTGVATGNMPESVQFTLPTGATPGVYLVSVIANGIASDPVLDVQMGTDNNDLTLLLDPNDASKLEVLNGDSLLAEFPVSSFRAIFITGNDLDN